jgi:hypothetical protein
MGQLVPLHREDDRGGARRAVADFVSKLHVEHVRLRVMVSYCRRGYGCTHSRGF